MKPLLAKLALLAATAVVALGGSGCLGTLRREPASEAIALAPQVVLRLPIRADRPYWLLRAEPGWGAAYEVRYGGDDSDPAVAVVRAVLFHDVGTAQRGFTRLTPDYLAVALGDRMNGKPRPFDYPEPLPGDAASVWLYRVRLPSDEARVVVEGQFTAVRSGRVLLFIESIGVTPDLLVPSVEAMIRAIDRLVPATPGLAHP